MDEFGSLLEAQVIVEAWRMEYNTYRPHGSLGGLTPAEYATKWPNISEKKEALPEAEEFKEKEGKRAMLSMEGFSG